MMTLATGERIRRSLPLRTRQKKAPASSGEIWGRRSKPC